MTKLPKILDDPFVSVIVPTYQSWEHLHRCLTALSEQDYPAERFEVIVINNDVAEPFPMSLFSINLLNKKYLVEPTPGSYAARNAGARQAKGEVLAFTDADCIPSSHWLKEAVSVIVKEQCDCVAGRIVLVTGSEKRSETDCYQLAFEFDQKRRARKGLSVTANLLISTAIFHKVGFFNELLYSGGDWEWCRRAKSLSAKMIYSHKAIVAHPTRATWRELFKKSRRINCSSNVKANYFIRIVFHVLTCFTIILPPVKKLFLLYDRSDLSGMEKFKAFYVAYVLKIHGKTVRLLNLLGVLASTRS